MSNKQLIKRLTAIAGHLHMSLSEASVFCSKVQSLFSPPPSLREILLVLINFPASRKSPEQAANILAQKLGGKFILLYTETPQIVTQEELIAKTAALFPKEENGNLAQAGKFLDDLERIYSRSKPVSNASKLQAIRIAGHHGALTIDGVIEELRKIIFGYLGDPDHIAEISIPTGGQSK